jgi:Ca2+-binding EF-hand superfamily protein
MKDMTLKRLDEIMAMVDDDNSGSIGFAEFLLTSVSPEDICGKAVLIFAFKDFDVDGSRDLSIWEIRNRITEGYSVKVPDSLWEGLFMMSKEKQKTSDISIQEADFAKLIKRALLNKNIEKEYIAFTR